MNERGQFKTQELFGEGGFSLPPKLAQVLESRKAWATVMGVAVTLVLWWLGEINGTRAVEAMTWVLGIFIGAVALEDGMARLFSTLSPVVVSHDSMAAGTPGVQGEDDEEAATDWE